MDAKLKEKWVAALRSGEYPQTRGALRRDEPLNSEMPAGYCCLGVLKAISAPPGEEVDWDSYKGIEDEFHTPGILTPAQISSCIHMNDCGKYSFAQIADVVENDYWEMSER